MIYLQEGNFPLNEAFSSEIVQEANSTYQLTFKFPTSDPKWALLTPETELVADDLHGEQHFTIFEVEKQHGYVTVYANQVATLLNGYSINKINVDRVNGATVMNALVAGFKRETPFTFFSDVMSKHTLNLKDVSAMEALAKDKHSIVGQWGGDLVRDKYSVRLLEHGGIENESLFAYKKNMKSFQESKSTKELRTRIHFKKVIEAHEEGKKDQILTVTIDSPLINKYKHIYEADMEVQDQDVVDQKTLEEYGKRYFRETLCDMIEESLEIDVVGQADQPVHMFDIVSIFHEDYDVDLRKKITKYKFNPMSIKLVSIGFGEVTRTLADSISGMVNDSVDKKMKSYDAEYEAKVQKLVDNANAEYDKQAKELEHKITDGIEQAKAQAEVVKQEINGIVAQKILESKQLTDSEISKANAKAEEALSKAGTFPSMESISAKLKDEILKSKDLSDKINQTFIESDNGTAIYSKISGEVTKKIVQVEDQVNKKISQTNQRIGDMSGSINSSLYSMNNQLGQMNNGLNKAKIDIVNAQGAANNANNKLILTDQKVDQANNRIDQTNRNLETTNRDLANTNSQVAANTRQIEVQVTNYNAVRESTKLFERILGTTEEGAPNKLSRLVMSSEIFQTEVGKYVTDDNNLIVNSMTMDKNTLVGNNNPKASVSVTDGIFTIKAQGLTGYNWSGFSLPIYVKKIYHGETYTLGFKYRIKEYPDSSFAFNIKNHGLNKILLASDIGKNKPPLDEWQEFQKTFTVQEDFAFGEDANYPFYIYLAKNGWIEFKEPILVRGSNTGPYKPSQFDDTFAETRALDAKIGQASNKALEAKQTAEGAQEKANGAKATADQATGDAQEARQLAIGAQARADRATGISQMAQEKAEDAQTKAIQVAEQARQAQQSAEATRTQVTQLAGSYSIKNINSAGDIISGVNLGADGTNRFVGKLTHITGETQIDNAVIKSAMVDKLKTGNFESGSVTTQILASDSVTADKLLVDSAMINKLVSNQAFIRELTSQKAFITQLASVDFSAERIKGGRLESNTRALVFDLDNSAMNMLTDTAVIRRVFNNFPTQFIRYGTHIENGNRFSKTIIGSNRDGTENSGNRTFSGIEIYNSTNENVEDYTKFYADKLYLQHSEYKQGWIIQNAGKPRIAPLNGTTYSEIIASDFRMIYTADGNHRSVGTYLWDLLTCFGILQRYGWDLKNSAAQSHIGSVLSKYNYR
jgi:phage minor structural protein, N-terminal domain protein